MKEKLEDMIATGKILFVERSGSWSREYLKKFDDLFIGYLKQNWIEYFEIQREFYMNNGKVYNLTAHTKDNKNIFLGWIYNLPQIHYNDKDLYIGFYNSNGTKRNKK